MLTHIYLKDFAIIETLDLELKSGMTALTGETGAGKSILIDAIGMVLGDRTDSGVVRHGAEKTEITLSIDLVNIPDAKKWLEAQELMQEGDDANECILRRVISSTGKSRAWINGSPCNLKMLRELGEQLVDIHGQHEHQSLMKNVTQRNLLDEFAKNVDLRTSVSNAYKSWKETHDKLEMLNNQYSKYQEKLILLRFQTQEFDELQISENEAPQLDEEHKRLSSSGELIEASSLATEQLYDSDEQSIYNSMNNVINQLDSAKELDSSLQEPLEMIKNAQIQIQEAADLLRRYQETVDLDPERLHWVNQRLSSLHDLARKHQTTPDQLFNKWQWLQEELNSLNGDDHDIESLEARLEEQRKAYESAATLLSTSRVNAASLLSDGVSIEMHELGMEGGQFSIVISQLDKFSNHGSDYIEFMVSANPGQPPKLLSKVASGGELSRISLAIQMIAAQRLTLPALIFDEVDSGIGGGIAEVVGKKLRKLGEDRQVLCVTHLPQVASCAHNHHKVTKLKSNTNTQTGMLVLDEEKRVEEIARMMGGVKITQKTLNLASEMLRN